MKFKTNKLLGERFGMLEVIGTSEPYLHKNGRRETVSVVKCDCGTVKSARNCSLTSGLTTSCGCQSRRMLIERNKKKSTTGMSHSRIYTVFRGMHARCENRKHVGFRNYGGKGISVCPEWRTFEAFYTWATSNGYDDSLTIDRINPNGNYEPSNCRFVTMAENTRNRPCVRRFLFRGSYLTIPEISKETGIAKACIRSRIRNGISPDIAFSIKSSHGNKLKKAS